MVDIVLDALFVAAWCLVIMTYSFMMRATAMKDRQKAHMTYNLFHVCGSWDPFD